MPGSIKLFGLKNCDSCRMAMKWLKGAGHEFQFADVRDGGMTAADVARIVGSAGAAVALNRKSATWRQLSETARSVSSDHQVVELIVQHPALMKRPVIEVDGEIIVGFGAAQQAALAVMLQ